MKSFRKLISFYPFNAELHTLLDKQMCSHFFWTFAASLVFAGNDTENHMNLCNVSTTFWGLKTLQKLAYCIYFACVAKKFGIYGSYNNVSFRCGLMSWQEQKKNTRQTPVRVSQFFRRCWKNDENQLRQVHSNLFSFFAFWVEKLAMHKHMVLNTAISKSKRDPNHVFIITVLLTFVVR